MLLQYSDNMSSTPRPPPGVSTPITRADTKTVDDARTALLSSLVQLQDTQTITKRELMRVIEYVFSYIKLLENSVAESERRQGELYRHVDSFTSKILDIFEKVQTRSGISVDLSSLRQQPLLQSYSPSYASIPAYTTSMLPMPQLQLQQQPSVTPALNPPLRPLQGGGKSSSGRSRKSVKRTLKKKSRVRTTKK